MDARPPAFEPVCMAPSGGKLGKLDWVRVRVNSAVVLDHVEKAALQWHGFKHGSYTVTGCPVPGYHATDVRKLFQGSWPGTSGILNDGALWTPPPHCSHGPGVFHHDNFAGASSYVTAAAEREGPWKCVVELKIYSCSVVGGGMAGRHVSKGIPNRPNRLVELVAVHFWTPMFALDSQWSIGCNVCIGPTGIHALHSSIESLSREIAKGCSELSWKLGEKHQMAWDLATKANKMCNYHKIDDYRLRRRWA